MKKLLLTLAFTLIVVTASFQGQIKQWIYPEKAISKNVSLNISPAANYGSKAYAHSTASLNVTLLKLKGHKVDTLLVKDFPEVPLKHLPSFSKEFNQVIHVPNVVDSKEQIVLCYNVKYRSKGSILEVPKMKWIHKGAAKDHLLINI